LVPVQDEITHLLDEAKAPDLWGSDSKEKESLSKLAVYSLYNSKSIRFDFKLPNPNVVLCGFLEVSTLRVPNESLRCLVFFHYDYNSKRWGFNCQE
jgi:hypothetical protein